MMNISALSVKTVSALSVKNVRNFRMKKVRGLSVLEREENEPFERGERGAALG